MRVARRTCRTTPFAVIVEGFNDLIAQARERNIEILTENHWGPTKDPDNTIKLLGALPELGLLFDSNNWIPERREEAWRSCAQYAKALHIKTFSFDEAGNDPSMDLELCFSLLKEAGYTGVWGIESTPDDGDEAAGVLGTLALIRRELGVGGLTWRHGHDRSLDSERKRRCHRTARAFAPGAPRLGHHHFSIRSWVPIWLCWGRPISGMACAVAAIRPATGCCWGAD